LSIVETRPGEDEILPFDTDFESPPDIRRIADHVRAECPNPHQPISRKLHPRP
jgi:hypothetical protein